MSETCTTSFVSSPLDARAQREAELEQLKLDYSNPLPTDSREKLHLQIKQHGHRASVMLLFSQFIRNRLERVRTLAFVANMRNQMTDFDFNSMYPEWESTYEPRNMSLSNQSSSTDDTRNNYLLFAETPVAIQSKRCDYPFETDPYLLYIREISTPSTHSHITAQGKLSLLRKADIVAPFEPIVPLMQTTPDKNTRPRLRVNVSQQKCANHDWKHKKKNKK